MTCAEYIKAGHFCHERRSVIRDAAAARPIYRDVPIDRGGDRGNDRDVPISFYDLLADDGWEPLAFDPADPTFYWNEGGFMAAAPVDIAATFDGAMWHSTSVEPAFKWQGRRMRPEFTVPKRHHNLRQLMIVVAGQLDIEYGDNDEKSQRIGPGEFWVAEKRVPYTMTVGPEPVTYLEGWTQPISILETYWHDDKNWKRPCPSIRSAT
jgi:mannose-6-phosphate isomerase-like protein (cupin superfamily)